MDPQKFWNKLRFTPKHKIVLRKLQVKAKALGGRVEQVTDQEWDVLSDGAVSQAPFTGWNLGVDHKAKTVYFSDWCLPSDVAEFACGLIHEMGHVFACKIAPDDMGNDAEFNFLGWELTLAKEIGLSRKAFCKGNSDYTLGVTGEDIGGLLMGTKKEQALLKTHFAERLKVAVKKGLIKNGRVRSIRA